MGRPLREGGRLPASGQLLLTGFEPFGGEQQNPSMALVRSLEGESIGGLRIVTAVLPCSFGRAPAALNAALEQSSPALVLAMGQAGGRSELSLERVAINLMDARIADNDGAQPVDQPVDPRGPAAYFSTLPIKAMMVASRSAGVPAAVSHSAGTFVCNQVFYILQHRLARQRVASGFMHLPWLPEQATAHPGAPSMPLATMAHGLREALVAAVRLLRRGEGDAPVSAGSLQ